MLVNQPLLAAKNLIPPLSPKLHKGQAGRVAVVGGSEDYTGAPYFSAISTLYTGADLCHVICEQNAGGPIKSYSPDLMVHPYLRLSGAKSGDTLANEIVERVAELLPRIHALVVGPGLSRDPLLLKCSGMIIEKAKERDMPIVIDADGLLLIQKNPALIAGYQNAILTPNVNEFRRLCDATGVKMDDGANHQLARQLSQALGGVTIIQKGAQDVITNGEEVLVCEEAGGLKRCGGQGDILSGVLGAFMAWGVGYRRKIWSHEGALEAQQISLLAAYAGCSVTRRASKLAFQRYGRATVTERVLDFIQPSFTDLFEVQEA
ncbi:Ribokinase-like protein [Dimargaris cristalligena]|uniref:ATP-dependent (S)-NAD(P)H-hydrate dehydratase n=1 Tax=Dimargaris cristalligena TaxID=215637 RepID=A0A4P9ZUW8_9FUNG|nr:Ribokinase-like protein [Dimargaris cristalligena]|eukprot:RKP37357.1 Ribokinase-like protein [Dimargaris cristalligena]